MLEYLQKYKIFLFVAFLFLIVPVAVNAETDDLGYEYTLKKASEIDFSEGDFFISLISGDPLTDDALYAVYESSEIERYEREQLGMSGFVLAASTPTKFSDYYSSSKWVNRSDGITLSLNPKKNAWQKPSNPIVEAHLYKYRWEVVYNKHKGSSNWDNTASMRAQLHCHADIAKGIKTPWNIEPWRTTSNYAAVVAAGCNPK